MSILEHHFPPLIAEKYGVNAAIFLRDIYHWCETNRNNEENFHEGRWWTYQTINGLCRRHTYWTKNQMEHIIRTCRDNGAILIGHFSDNQFDRTSWYALSDEAMALFEGTDSISEISEIECNKTSPSLRKNQKCYKDKYKTEDKTNNPIAPCENDPDWVMFNRFWNAYPKKKDKLTARKAWKRLNPNIELCRTMSDALNLDKRSESWAEKSGKYIPYPAVWLNAHRWEDEHEECDSSPGSAWAPDPEAM